MKRASKVDANQAEIVAALRRVGCYVLHLHQLKNAFDLLVFWRGQTWCIEVKDGSKPPSKRKLTEGEQACKDGLERVGVKYHIIESVDQALRLVGAVNPYKRMKKQLWLFRIFVTVAKRKLKHNPKNEIHRISTIQQHSTHQSRKHARFYRH